MITKAFLQGFICATVGKPYEECPFGNLNSDMIDERDEWFKGWFEGSDPSSDAMFEFLELQNIKGG